MQKPADWICSACFSDWALLIPLEFRSWHPAFATPKLKASDVDKKKGRKLDPNEDLRNKGFKAGVTDKVSKLAQSLLSADHERPAGLQVCGA